MTTLGPLFHWSPRARLAGITRKGLQPGQRNAVLEPSYYEDEDGVLRLDPFRQQAVCTSGDPETAWLYSHGTWGSTGTFDLWLFRLVATDEVEVLPAWGAELVEIRVRNAVPKSRLRWIGERTVAPEDVKNRRRDPFAGPGVRRAR